LRRGLRRAFMLLLTNDEMHEAFAHGHDANS